MTSTAMAATDPSAAKMIPIRWEIESCFRTDWTCSFIDRPPSQLSSHDFLVGLEQLVPHGSGRLEADGGLLHLEHYGVQVGRAARGEVGQGRVGRGELSVQAAERVAQGVQEGVARRAGSAGRAVDRVAAPDRAGARDGARAR